MTTLPSMAERHAFGLEMLAEMTGKLVQVAYERAVRPSDPADQDRAILLFDRLARGFRLTVALEARMERDRRRDATGVSPETLPAEASPASLAPPLAGPRPARPAREDDHERDADLEPSDLPGHIREVRRLVAEDANILDPEGIHAEALDRYAAWLAGEPGEEAGATHPSDTLSAQRQAGWSGSPRPTRGDPPRRASG